MIKGILVKFQPMDELSMTRNEPCQSNSFNSNTVLCFCASVPPCSPKAHSDNAIPQHAPTMCSNPIMVVQCYWNSSVHLSHRKSRSKFGSLPYPSDFQFFQKNLLVSSLDFLTMQCKSYQGGHALEMLSIECV